MAEADKNLKVKIVTEAELAGAKAAEKSLQDVSKAAGQQAAPALAQAAEGTKKVDEASKGFASSAGKLWEGLRKVTNILPGLGMAGLIGLVYEAFNKLLRPTDELAGKIDNLATKLSAIQDALAEGKLKTDAWEKGLAAISEKAESAAEHLKQVNDEIERAKGREMKLLDAEQGVEMAKAGQIADPVKRKERELQIEQQFAERRQQLELKTLANREAAEKMAVAQAEIQAKENGDKKRSAQKELDNLEIQDKNSKERIEKERARLAELDKAETSAEEGLNAAQTGPHYGPYRGEAIKQAQEALAKAQAERKAQEALVSGEEKNRLAIGEQINSRKQDVETYGGLQKANTQFLNERTRRPQLPGMQQDRETLQRQFGLETEARGLRGQSALDDLRTQKKGRAGAAGPDGTDPITDRVEGLRSRVEGLPGANQQALAGALGSLAQAIERRMGGGGDDGIVRMIQQLEERVSSVETKVRPMRKPLAGE